MVDYQDLKKIFFKFSPENAHHFAELGFRFAGSVAPMILNPITEEYFVTNDKLEQTLFGVKFLNPVGIAAGFDKNATMFKALTALGFGYIEYGTMTPKPQSGNKKPRLFRHIEEESLQNAMGFNNQGAEKIAKRVKKLYPYITPIGANIGKNKTTLDENALFDYVELVKTFSPLSDYLAVNISSPNTPGLRSLQNTKFVKELFNECIKLTDKPILLKIAPDMEAHEAIELCAVALDCGAKGIIATNTTIDYSLVKNPKDFGGISGKVLKDKSFKMFDELAREFYKHTTLISVGGIDSAEDVYKRVRAGASLVQLYTSFIFKGPIVNFNINNDLTKLIERDGLNNISELIGSGR
ncbi:MAG: quinone-dependent dihydroorotate dehydrogenase [Campylobacteraceae bacterium]